jgi:hypothetical protein
VSTGGNPVYGTGERNSEAPAPTVRGKSVVPVIQPVRAEGGAVGAAGGYVANGGNTPRWKTGRSVNAPRARPLSDSGQTLMDVTPSS